MYVIRRRRPDAILVAEYLHRDDAGIFWVPDSSSRARHYATRAEAMAAFEILYHFQTDLYFIDCIHIEKGC